MILLLAQAALLPITLFPDAFRVGIVGDSQQNNFNVFGQHCQNLRAEGISLFIGLGDHVQDHGLPGEWQSQFVTPLSPIASLPRFGALGNHDDVSGYSANFWAIPQNPLTSPYGNAIGCWGAVTWGPVRWVFLDTNEDPTIRLSLDPRGSQRAWLETEAAGDPFRLAGFRVVAFHHPVSTEQWDGGCFYPVLPERRWLMDRLASLHVSLVLNGHSHAYQRGAWNGIPWIISGGGGGWLDTTHCQDLPEITVAQAVWHCLVLEVTQETMTVRAIDTQRREIDRIVIR